jgi:hypothetical protein
MSETIDIYRVARRRLEESGFKINAIVLDGRPGVRDIFIDVPVQMCHFHQMMIITRYLTTKPKLEAGIELRHIASTLGASNEIAFGEKLETWHRRWFEFLKEKTIDSITGKWHYTHKRLRSAYRSLKINLPYLFTYQKYPELDIPNTTNSLDGSFSHLKDLVIIHRGLSPEIKRKAINEVLNK